MATGTVKWFSNSKGYGFIMSTDTDEDIFAHFSAIEMDGYKTLKQGQPVEYVCQISWPDKPASPDQFFTNPVL